MDKKTSLRLKAKEIRNNLDIKQISNIITKKISKLDIFMSAKNIMLFYPLDSEINILGLLDFEEKKFFLPRMNDKNLECCPYQKGDILKKVKYNIQEPQTKCDICPNLDLVIVPALAIDRYGNRLGYGGGFYDRFLKGNKFKTLVPIPNCLVLDSVPSEVFDIKINYAITEKEFVII